MQPGYAPHWQEASASSSAEKAISDHDQGQSLLVAEGGKPFGNEEVKEGDKDASHEVEAESEDHKEAEAVAEDPVTPAKACTNAGEPGTRKKLRQLQGELPSGQKNPEGLIFSKAERCVFCGREKHSCAWQYRSTSMKPIRTVVTGSQCDSCVQACKKLQCGRAIQPILETRGLRAKVAALSREISAKRQALGGDVCSCAQCAS